MKDILIHMNVHLLKTYLNSLQNAMNVVFIPNMKNKVLQTKRDSYCASFCLYLIYFTKVVETDLKSAVLKSYYQILQER